MVPVKEVTRKSKTLEEMNQHFQKLSNGTQDFPNPKVGIYKSIIYIY